MYLFLVTSLFAQMVTLEGIIKDNQNNRKLHNAAVTINDDTGSAPILANTDNFGRYSIQLKSGSKYSIEVERIAFINKQEEINIPANSPDKVNLDIAMQRLAGYEFQADVKELLSIGRDKEKHLGKELVNLKIEIYNNTSGKEIRVTEDDPKNTFEANFERGNHYTILLRKKGYFAKRIEVNVDIYGCVLCFEGLGNDYAPEIESATSGSDRGVLIADIPMKKIVKDEAIRLDNIYYDYDKWAIRTDAKPALNKLIQTLRNNPIIIELGSHTDSRGTDNYNMNLSDKRAKSAVDYIISKGVKASRITSKGYGESMPLNNCVDEVKCSDQDYQFNRRTEFKVTGFLETSNYDKKTLKQMLQEEKTSNKRLQEQIEGI